MESAMTVILCDASEKMHHGILFDPPLGLPNKQKCPWQEAGETVQITDK